MLGSTRKPCTSTFSVISNFRMSSWMNCAPGFADTSWPPFCLPLFTSDGLHLYFSALTAHFGQWLEVDRRGRKVQQWQVATELIYLWSGEKKLPTAQAGAGLPGDAAWNRGRSQSRLTGMRLLWTVEHGLYRAGSTDRPTWGGSPCSPYLGHFSTGFTASGPSRVVACLLSLCASSPITASSARAATRARWQTGGATRPPPYGSSGSWQNHPTMDGAGGALIPIAIGFRLSALQA